MPKKPTVHHSRKPEKKPEVKIERINTHKLTQTQLDKLAKAIHDTTASVKDKEIISSAVMEALGVTDRERFLIAVNEREFIG